MKRVRFLTPCKDLTNVMEESECHSPRPFIDKPLQNVPQEFYERLLPYCSDPVQRFETSNSSPYPKVNKTTITAYHNATPQCSPSNDLDLSMLDASNQVPRRPIAYQSFNSFESNTPITHKQPTTRVLSSLENTVKIPPNILMKDDNFFIRRDNIDRYGLCTDEVQKQFNHLTLDKENNPLARKVDIMTMGKIISPVKVTPPGNIMDDVCKCHHCVKTVPSNGTQYVSNKAALTTPHNTECNSRMKHNYCHCVPTVPKCHCNTTSLQKCHKPCGCEDANMKSPTPQNAVEKKNWAIQQYEQSKNPTSMEVEKQTNITKEKREPTVADLFKIIKLQNEQLQLLQEKVDRFISASNKPVQNVQVPVQGYMTEQVAIQNIDSQYAEQHKISIGVMTSFEMVRTATVINKEFVQQTENAQIQCNRSQISIKEVISKAQPVNLNFLDGITPVQKVSQVAVQSDAMDDNRDYGLDTDLNDDKTLNEYSLYNVQVDNATTPLISPEQSLYLDVKDYSDSDSSSDDQSNVGWTYYNKVMTHVNGMLQDSDMPSSASALYRNTRQCLQMQVDKTNLSVTKRVKFGDDPMRIQQPHIYAASTDTSMKMNQLAAKYLKSKPVTPQPILPKPIIKDVDMSLATKNYMKRHKLLQDPDSPSPPLNELPKFLDITALKQQPKLL